MRVIVGKSCVECKAVSVDKSELSIWSLDGRLYCVKYDNDVEALQALYSICKNGYLDTAGRDYYI